jgi:hypothetical protein
LNSRWEELALKLMADHLCAEYRLLLSSTELHSVIFRQKMQSVTVSTAYGLQEGESLLIFWQRKIIF